MSEECEGSGGYGCGVSAFHCECESKCRIQRPTKDEAMVAPIMTSAAMATGSGHGRSPSGVWLMPPRGKLILVKRPKGANNEVRPRGHDPLDNCVVGNSAILDSELDMVICLDARHIEGSSKKTKNGERMGKIAHDRKSVFALHLPEDIWHLHQ